MYFWVIQEYLWVAQGYIMLGLHRCILCYSGVFVGCSEEIYGNTGVFFDYSQVILGIVGYSGVNLGYSEALMG